MDSHEIDPFTSERILEAASRGELLEGSGELGALLTSLHDDPSAAECSGVLPADAVVGEPIGTIAGRVTRRAAATASVALFALTGVAAAVTGVSGGIFGPILTSDTEIDIGLASVAESDVADEPIVVDPSDGLSDEELTVLCDEASNHGEYISQVAQDQVTEGSHGERIAAGAQTNCGSPETDTDVDDVATADVPVVVDPSDGLSDEELTVLCDEASNHGEYVAEVAQDQITEGSHGERVATEADSDCGAPEIDTDGGGNDVAVGGQPDPLPIPDPLPSDDGIEVIDNVRTGNNGQGQNPNG